MSRIRSLASVIIYKIYRFREAERRAGEKKEKIHKIHKISLACEQVKNIHKIYKISLACEQEILNVNARECPWMPENIS